MPRPSIKYPNNVIGHDHNPTPHMWEFFCSPCDIFPRWIWCVVVNRSLCMRKMHACWPEGGCKVFQGLMESLCGQHFGGQPIGCWALSMDFQHLEEPPTPTLQGRPMTGLTGLPNGPRHLIVTCFGSPFDITSKRVSVSELWSGPARFLGTHAHLTPMLGVNVSPVTQDSPTCCPLGW